MSDTDYLSSQYEQAIGLYRQEDELNWKKIQHALYVNAALATAAGVDSLQTMSWFIALFAALGNLLFLITLENGRRFMLARLEAVKKVEKAIGKKGGLYPLLSDVAVPVWLPRTMSVMRGLLTLLIVVWIILAVLWKPAG